MSAIRAIFKPSKDGSIHIPIPQELRGNARLRVVAWIEPDTENPKMPGAGEWAKLARGIARPQTDETSDDARFAAVRQRFQAP